MSQYTVELNYQGPSSRAIVGFDSRLDEYFLDYLQDGEIVYTSLSESDYRDNFFLAKKMAELQIVLPTALFVELKLAGMGFQKALNAGNASASYSVDALTPVQAQLLRLNALQVITSSIGDPAEEKVLWAVLAEDFEGESADNDPDSSQECVFIKTPTLEFAAPVHLAVKAGLPADGGELGDEELLVALLALEKMAPKSKPSVDQE